MLAKGLKCFGLIGIAFFLLIKSSLVYAGFVGINTNEVLPVDSSLPFTNLFKVSTPFNESSLTRGKVDFDEDGWVSFMHEKARAGAYFLQNMPMDALPKGQYVVSYDGVGKSFNIREERVELGESTNSRFLLNAWLYKCVLFALSNTLATASISL